MSNPGTDRLDLSFLQEEEASQILEVLERDELLRRTERDRLSKLQSSKRDVKCLHALSGEWFEEIQKKKFKNDPDVRSLVRPPLTHRLMKKTPKGESESSKMTTSRNYQTQKNSSSRPSLFGLRSPFSSLFSFRKFSKQNVKHSPQPERHGFFSITNRTPPSTEVKKKFEIYQTTRRVKQIASLFETQQNGENETAPSTTQLERKANQGDLDQKLTHEQSPDQALRTSRLPSYKHGGHYSNEGSLHNTSEFRKDYSSLSSHDGRRIVSHGEGHTTHATYQPRMFYEMYSNRHRTASKQEPANKNVYGKSPSLCSALKNKSPCSAPSSGTFSSSSLQPTSMRLDLDSTRQHKSRITPVSAIKWNNALSSGHPEHSARPFRTQSALDLTNLGSSTPHNRIFELYKRGPSSTTNELHRVNYGNDTTSTALHYNSDNGSTGYYKTDSRGSRTVSKFPQRNTRHWEEENKENAFKRNEMTSNPPSTNSGINNDKDMEPMELENESPVQSDCNIVGNNLQGCAETFSVTSNTNKIRDLGNFRLKTEDNAVNAYSGLQFTDRDLAFDASQSLEHSFEHSTISNLRANENDWRNPVSHKMSTLFSSTSDIVGRLAHLNMRWGSKDNRSEGFMSDMLKHQRRNASSLPDLIDQQSYLFSNNDEPILLKNNHEKAGDCHSTTASEAKPTRVTNESNETSIDNSRTSKHSCVQNTTGQAKESNSRTLQYLQKPYIFSCITSGEREQKTTLSEDVSHLTDITAENSETKKTFDATDTNPTFSDLRLRYKSIFPYRSYGQNTADTNNNRQSIKMTQSSEEFGKSESKTKSICVYPKGDCHEAEPVKTSECEISSKPDLYVPYQQDVVSLTNQQNSDRSVQANRNFKPDININHNLIHHLDQQANNKVLESIEPPKVKDMSIFPTRRIVEEHLQRSSSSRAVCQPSTENKSTNLLLAPEPFKRNTNVKENTMPPWNCPTSSEDVQTPSIYKCSISNITTDRSTETKPSHENVGNTDTFQRVTENTQIYETTYTDSSQPDVDKIEYHKIVSVYYSLPRKYSKRISNLSQNNLKNIDRTLEISRAPRALLDKMVNRYLETEEKPDSSYQNFAETSPCNTENVHTKELNPGDRAQCKPHRLNFHIIPLQTNLMHKGSSSFSGEETTSPSYDFVDKFSSLHISESEGNHRAKEDLQMQRNLKNKNEHSPSGSSPKYTQNTYHTFPNRKSSLQDLETNILEKDIAMARDRYNIYSHRENMAPTPPGFQDVFSSPPYSYDNLNYSPGYDLTHFQETSRQENNMNNFFIRDDGLDKKDSFDKGIFSREEVPSVYRAKSMKDLNMRKSYHTRDISPNMEFHTNPQIYNQRNFTQMNTGLNRTRPSYCSEFVQKKMKPINAKRFTYSFDQTGQQEYGSSIRKSDTDSPSVFHSPNNNYPSHINKHYYGRGSPTYCRSAKGSNLYRSKSLKILNAKNQEDLMETRRKSNGSFSSKSHGGNLRSRSPSVYDDSSGTTYNRRFSADLIIDENDNWPITETSHEHKPVYTSKSLDYGIFGKEQQAALLNNVKRSLTEGRIWRPNLLKNPGFRRNEKHYSSQESHPIGCSHSDVLSHGPSLTGSLNIYEEPPVCSDSDTETTTDDEYYLDENDRESEL